MIFNFVLYNHNAIGQRSLEDVIGIMGHQLRAIGHEAVWVPGKADFIGPKDGINVLVEGFTQPLVDDIVRCHAAGARFLCLATEEPTPRGFNHGTQKEMVRRQELFPKVAPYFEGILHLVPGAHVSEWYGQFQRADGRGPVRAAAVELGYAPTLVGTPNPDAEWATGFYGTLSQRRANVLKALAKRMGGPGCRLFTYVNEKTRREEGLAAMRWDRTVVKAVRIVADFAPQAERDAAMRECRVALQVRKFDAMQLVSNCRLAMCIGVIGVPVVGEKHDNAAEWEGIVPFSATTEQFYRDAVVASARSVARGMHAKQLAAMKAIMSPERCVGQALRAVNLEETLRAAA